MTRTVANYDADAEYDYKGLYNSYFLNDFNDYR
jgi:hypothetical protein